MKIGKPLSAAVTALVLLLTCGATLAAGLNARLDRQEMFFGDDPLVLTLWVDGDEIQGEPDFGPLLGEFELLGRPSTSSRTEIVNGRISSRRLWSVSLAPRRPGTISIPPLSVGNLSSAPITVRVKEAPDNAVNDPDLQLRVSVDVSDPYVQQQVIYTLQILNGLPINRATEPRLDWPEGVVYQRLPAVPPSWQQIGNRRFRVNTVRYALFPERSGSLEIDGPRYTAWLSDSASRSAFSPGRRVDVIGEPVTLLVKPQSTRFDGAIWLPAKQVQLAERWPAGHRSDAFTVGQPVAWTIGLTVNGQLSTQLPELALASVDGLRIYAEKPSRDDNVDGGWVSRRTEQMQVIPDRAGQLTLPEVRVSWWDTAADQQREAVLPARTIDVAPAADTASPAEPSITVPVVEATDSASPPIGRSTRGNTVLAWAGFTLWLLTLIGWWWERRARQSRAEKRPEPAAPKAPPVTQQRQSFQRACKANDPQAAARRLLAWARAERSDIGPLTLPRLAGLLNDQTLVDEIRELDKVLYRGNRSDWSGQSMGNLVNKTLPWLKPGNSATTATVLPELYPVENS